MTNWQRSMADKKEGKTQKIDKKDAKIKTLRRKNHFDDQDWLVVHSQTAISS